MKTFLHNVITEFQIQSSPVLVLPDNKSKHKPRFFSTKKLKQLFTQLTINKEKKQTDLLRLTDHFFFHVYIFHHGHTLINIYTHLFFMTTSWLPKDVLNFSTVFSQS